MEELQEDTKYLVSMGRQEELVLHLDSGRLALFLISRMTLDKSPNPSEYPP